jgi:hypothetical protein
MWRRQWLKVRGQVKVDVDAGWEKQGDRLEAGGARVV